MPSVEGRATFNTFNRLRILNISPLALALAPAITVAANWMGGEQLMLLVALSVPVAMLVISHFTAIRNLGGLTTDGITGLPLRNGALQWLANALNHAETEHRKVAILCLSVDDLDELEARLGPKMRDVVMAGTVQRLRPLVRHGDIIFSLSNNQLGVAIGAHPGATTDLLLELSRRFQTAFEDPFEFEGMRAYVSISIGFAISDLVERPTPDILINAAERALEMAEANGPGSVRAYSRDMASISRKDKDLLKTATDALDSGQFEAWFQPQISTDTGDVTGFETLARWHHPERGIVPPAKFLPLLEKLGLSERLAEVMLSQALDALCAWDRAGMTVPSVAVNFSTDELRNPKLAEKVEWELERHGMPPERLGVEVLETVIAETHEDIVARNLRKLAKLGCRIDLDDFGTGKSSIVNIRRFAVKRIKIDRSMVTNVDRDRDQQALVSAILLMSDQLDLETLAEGVENQNEHAILSQMGCQHIQGFSIAKPMPVHETLAWLKAYEGRPRPDLSLPGSVKAHLKASRGGFSGKTA